MKVLNHAPAYLKFLTAYLFVSRLQGKLVEALNLFKKSLAIRKQVLGDDHPDVAESLNNIAGLHQDQVL